MRLKALRKTAMSLAFLGSLMAIGCSAEKDRQATVKGQALQPKPSGDLGAIESRLMRYRGQTQFLNAQGSYGCPFCQYDTSVATASAQSKGTTDEKREQQESDIYKVGKPGSKILYLLNNYRGLQVISYHQGDENPVLMGRVQPSGNWPDAMYFDQDHDRLIVLENTWYDASSDRYSYSSEQSRLVVYDVSKPESPKIASTLALTGTLADSRMVGSILYVATSVRPSHDAQQRGEKGQGYISSFDLSGSSIAQVERHQLSMPVNYGDNMNIVEEEVAGAYRYYLIAKVSPNGWSWGWRGESSLLEVSDISDSKGDVKPLMVVTARGFVRERSQTFIRNATLIVASNYAAANGIQRVAVETFRLPEATSEIISTEEAQYRQMHIKRELQKFEQQLKSQGVSGDALIDQLDSQYQKLLDNNEFGLRQRFVAGDNSSVTKYVSDHQLSVGSTQGLNAMIQDVRPHGNMLYVFWVPQNNIDSLDLFDISQPENGIKHLSHLEFDGWIEKAIPMTYKGRQFIVGLGWVFPSTDERSRRYPQAMLFEINKDRHGGYKAELIDSMKFGDSNSWVNFNSPDKFIEIRDNGAGQGTIMFVSDSWNWGSYTNTSGGKLIGFDLEAAFSEDRAIFAEGGILAGNAGWLRRVFTNSEINRVNSFSDLALNTYAKVDKGIGSPKEVIAAVNSLELARNIRDYRILSTSRLRRGVQIIADNNYYYYGRNGDVADTELRLVRSETADAELPQVIYSTTVKGTLVYSELLDERTIALLLNHNYYKDSRYFNETSVAVYRMDGNGRSLKLLLTQNWKNDDAALAKDALNFNASTFIKSGESLLFPVYSRLHALTAANRDGDVALTKVELRSCDARIASASFSAVSGLLVAQVQEQVKDDSKDDVNYSASYFSMLTPIDQSMKALSCSPWRNIPGRLVALLDAGSTVITEDERVVDIIKSPSTTAANTTKVGTKPRSQVLTEKAYIALKLDDKRKDQMRLSDLYNPEGADFSALLQVGNWFATIENQSSEDSYPIYYKGYAESDSMFYPYRSYSQARLSLLTVDADGFFAQVSKGLTDRVTGTNQLSALFSHQNDYIGVVRSGLSYQAFRLSKDLSQMSWLKLRAINAGGEAGAEQDRIFDAGYPSYWWYGNNNSGYAWDAGDNTISIANGLHGVNQFKVVLQ